MVKRRGACKGRKKGTSGESTSATNSKFVAPTSGHKDVYFTTGSTKDAAAFQGTAQKCVWQLSIAAGWKQGPTLGKAMTDLRYPVFRVEPTDQAGDTALLPGQRGNNGSVNISDKERRGHG